ncbi:unnamed protein product [Closterium sp. NIES-54]
MEVSQTSMCHVGAPLFLWPQAVRYAAHQLNLWPSDAQPRPHPLSHPAPSGVSHVIPQSSPPQRPVPVVSGDAGGAVAEGEGIGAAGARGASSGGAGGVRVETTPEEDTAVLTQRPRPASPPGFPSFPQFPPRSPPRPVAAEPGGVPAGGTGYPRGVVGAGSESGGAGAGETSTVMPTPRTVRFVPQQRSLEEAEQQRLRDLPDSAPARFVRGPVMSPPVPPVKSLSSSQWTRRFPLSRAVSPEPHRSRYRADGPFHLVLLSRVPPPPVLPQPPKSSLTVFHDPLSDYLRASRPIVSRVLSVLVTHPTAPLSSVSALVTTVVGFASSHSLDYAAHLVSGPARSPLFGCAPNFPLEVLEDRQFDLGFLAAAVPHLCALLLALERDPDALDIPIPCTHAEAVSGPWASYWIAAEEAEMASYRSTGTYIDTVPPPGANVVSGMWLYKVKRPPGAPPVFKARYVARGFSQREGVDFFQAFAPTPKMTTLWVLLHIAAQRDYELHSLDFSTEFLQGSLHEQIWLRCSPSFTGSFPPGTQWQLRRPVYGLRQAPREWHDTLRTTLAALDFFPLSADPSLFVRRGSTPFFVLVYVDDLVFATPDRRALASVKEELQRRRTCTDLGELQCYLGLQITRYRAARTITPTQLHMVEQILMRFRFPFSKVQPTPLAVDHGLTAPPLDEPFMSSGPYPELGYCFSLGTGAVSWRSTRASSDSSSSCETEVYSAAMAAKELRWLSFLLTDLDERPRSPPVLFADNRSAVLFCEEPRLDGKAKHIQLRYFLLREFQQRGQACVVRVVSEANIADFFTKALPPCAHQRFCTQLGLVSTGHHLLA